MILALNDEEVQKTSLSRGTSSRSGLRNRGVVGCGWKETG